MINADYQESAPTAEGGGSGAIPTQSIASDNAGERACCKRHIFTSRKYSRKNNISFQQLSFDFENNCGRQQRGGK